VRVPHSGAAVRCGGHDLGVASDLVREGGVRLTTHTHTHTHTHTTHSHTHTHTHTRSHNPNRRFRTLESPAALCDKEGSVSSHARTHAHTHTHTHTRAHTHTHRHTRSHDSNSHSLFAGHMTLESPATLCEKVGSGGAGPACPIVDRT